MYVSIECLCKWVDSTWVSAWWLSPHKVSFHSDSVIDAIQTISIGRMHCLLPAVAVGGSVRASAGCVSSIIVLFGVFSRSITVSFGSVHSMVSSLQ